MALYRVVIKVTTVVETDSADDAFFVASGAALGLPWRYRRPYRWLPWRRRMRVVGQRGAGLVHMPVEVD